MAGFLDTTPARFRHWSILAFGAWSAGIWLTRVRNIFTDESLDATGKVLWLVPALGLGLGGVLALWAWWQGRAGLARPLAAVLLATIVYWPVRTVIMLFGDHSVGFRLVHLALAIVSVGLAVAAGRRLQRTNLIPRGAYR
jgi:hypothetical protein